MYKIIVKDLANCQPVFQAYCKAKGLRDGDVWITYEFMIWASGMAAEFQRVLALGEGELETRRDEYVSWIIAEVGGIEKDAN